eukprot:5530365-Prymnesium_polylepis.1
MAVMNLIFRCAFYTARIANEHGAVTFTLVGMFFLIRGTSGAEIDPTATLPAVGLGGEQPQELEFPSTPDDEAPDSPSNDTSATGLGLQ